MKLLHSPKSKDRLIEIYLRNLHRVSDLLEVGDPLDKSRRLQQWVFYSVRLTNLFPAPTNLEEARERLALYRTLIDGAIGSLTPAELVQVFPITKDFRGAKRGEKDYFFTLDIINKHGWNKPIGDQAYDFIWDYVNPELQELLVGLLTTVSALRRFRGQEGLIEQYFGVVPLSRVGRSLPRLTLVKKEESSHARQGATGGRMD